MSGVVPRPRPVVTVAGRVPTATGMRALGERLAAVLRGGDLVMLTGDLGAGKTTLTQGLGAGLRVRGDVTSPTFVIARVHPSTVGGPALVHVDAYRLGSLAEVDDLDLDASLEDSVTVVEWGTGLVEDLADSRLEIRLLRATGGDVSGDDEPAGGGLDGDGLDTDGPGADGLDGDDPRAVEIVGYGARWAGVALPPVAADAASDGAPDAAPGGGEG